MKNKQEPTYAELGAMEEAAEREAIAKLSPKQRLDRESAALTDFWRRHPDAADRFYESM